MPLGNPQSGVALDFLASPLANPAARLVPAVKYIEESSSN
jgi:hypothetical protein